mgnify:CR=1 FL=1
MLFAQGFSIGSVAEKLGIERSTAQSHSKAVYRKLGIHTKDELIALVQGGGAGKPFVQSMLLDLQADPQAPPEPLPLGLKVLAADIWPDVQIVTSHAGADGRLVDLLVQVGVQGLVVAATGNGSVHQDLMAALLRAQAAGVLVLRALRGGAGCIVPSATDLLPDAGHHRPAFINLQQYYVEGYLFERASDGFSNLVGSSTTAVNSDNAGNFVYLVETKNTVLGVQSVLVRLGVTVEERGDGVVRISGALSGQEQIVSASSKPLSAGTEVRIDE